MSAPQPIRVGAVSYLNALPLTIALRNDDRIALTEDVPSAVSDGLRAGEIDVGLVPIAEVLRHPDWGRVPGLGIVSNGPVETVLLASRVPFGDIARLGLDVSSRTSAILVRIVLDDRFGATPVTVPVTPAAGAPDEPAWLVIGDPSFDVHNGPDLRILDLGAAWRDLTGKPMVYAIWATRAGLHPETVAGVLGEARREGERTMESWLAEEASHRRVGTERARRYLRESILYDVGEPEVAGMEEFEVRGRKLGLL